MAKRYMKISAFALFISAAPAYSQVDVSQCDAALVNARIDQRSTLHHDYRVTVLVEREQWTRAHSELGVEGVIEGVPLGGSYDEFRENRARLLNRTDTQITHNEARSYAWQGLDPDALPAYQACLEVISSGSHLITLGASGISTETHVALNLRWNPPVESSDREVLLTWQVSDGASMILPPKLTPTSEPFQVLVNRPPTGSRIVSVSGRYADGRLVAGSSVVVVAEAPIPEPSQAREQWSDTFGTQGTISEALPTGAAGRWVTLETTVSAHTLARDTFGRVAITVSLELAGNERQICDNPGIQGSEGISTSIPVSSEHPCRFQVPDGGGRLIIRTRQYPPSQVHHDTLRAQLFY